jgi:hypothetical protein
MKGDSSWPLRGCLVAAVAIVGLLLLGTVATALLFFYGRGRP